jgi:hypothetical protein
MVGLETLRQQAQAKVIMGAREIITEGFTVQAVAAVLVPSGLMVLGQLAATVVQGLHHQLRVRL